MQRQISSYDLHSQGCKVLSPILSHLNSPLTWEVNKQDDHLYAHFTDEVKEVQ